MLLMEANHLINECGFLPRTCKPLGSCAGTVVWLIEETLYVFHAGDIAALLIRDRRLQNHTNCMSAQFSIFLVLDPIFRNKGNFGSINRGSRLAPTSDNRV